VGHDLKFESPGGNDAGSSFSASRRDADAQNERDGAGLRCSVTAATPSQQRLRRSSVAAALRAASAPSQQHQLDATRRMSATELVCAYPSQQRLRRSSDSVAAATPSQLRRSSAARTMSGRRGIGRSSPSGKFAKNRGTRHKLLLFNTLISLKSLGHSPAPGFFFGGLFYF